MLDPLSSGMHTLTFGATVPSPCSQASVRLSIRSLLKLFILSSLAPVSVFQPRYKCLYRSPRVRREVIAPRLRVDHQQVKRHSRIMVEVDDADPASLAAALPTPPEGGCAL